MAGRDAGAVLVELLPAACAVVDGDGGGVFARVDEVAEPVGACGVGVYPSVASCGAAAAELEQVFGLVEPVEGVASRFPVVDAVAAPVAAGFPVAHGASVSVSPLYGSAGLGCWLAAHRLAFRWHSLMISLAFCSGLMPVFTQAQKSVLIASVKVPAGTWSRMWPVIHRSSMTVPSGSACR